MELAMNWPLLTLFVLGNILAILGWFFDRTREIDWLARVMVRDYVYGSRALDDLATDPKRAILPSHLGFNVLLTRWPNLPNKKAVASIGRSIAFTEFGPEVKNDIELIALDQALNHLESRWLFSSARQELQKQADKRIFIFGTIMFFLGIAVSIASGVIEFIG
jgi:hypothetical protein